jgi:hypothetical protein
MILRGIAQFSDENIYFGRDHFSEEQGFLWIISDTPDSTLGFTLHAGKEMELMGAIKLFLQDIYAGPFNKRKKEIERQVEVCKKYHDRFPNLKQPNALHEKYNVYP